MIWLAVALLFFDRPGVAGAVFAIAKIRRIGHDHQAPFRVLIVLGISSGDTRRKQTTTWPIYLRPPIFFTDSGPPIK